MIMISIIRKLVIARAIALMIDNDSITVPRVSASLTVEIQGDFGNIGVR